MRKIFTRNDKVRIVISACLLLICLIAMWVAFTPWFNDLTCPPSNATHCSEDGNGYAVILLLLAGAIAVVSVIFLALSITFRLAYVKIGKIGQSTVVAVLLVAAVAGIVTYALSASSRANTKHIKEITSGLRDKQANFVAYSSTPVYKDIATQSNAFTIEQDNLTLNLYDCNPGAGKVTYATGTTYFVMSGVQADKNIGKYGYKCVFYMDAVVNGQAWDGILPVKCEWPINPDLTSSNYRGMSVNDTGIDFRDFPLLYCQDVRTGKQSTNPAFSNR